MTANELRQKLFMVEDQDMTVSQLRGHLFRQDQDAAVDFDAINLRHRIVFVRDEEPEWRAY